MLTGARACTSYGAGAASDYAQQIAAAGGRIINGLAFGIDVAAVRGALRAGMAPIIVAAAGLQCLYPDAHAATYGAVLDAGGLVVSLADDLAAVPTRLGLQRRLWWTAAVSARTLIVEAATRSSSLIAVAGATAAGRPIGAVPGPVTALTSFGPNSLIGDSTAAAVYSAPSLDLFLNT